LRRIVDDLPNGDLAAVVFTSAQTGLQEFTADKERLRKAVSTFAGRRSDAGEAHDRSISEQAFGSTTSAGGEHLQNLRRSLDTLRDVATWLKSVSHERRSILYLTAGLPASMEHAFTDSGIAAREYRQVVAAAQDAHVAIYPIDLRGLSGADDTDSGTFGLRTIASDTGGFASINTNNLSAALRRIVDEASHYYLVAIERPSEKSSGRQHVVIRTRRANVRVRTHSGFIEDASSSSNRRPTLRKLIASPLPGGGIALSLQPATFVKTGRLVRALVTAEFSGGALLFRETNGKNDAMLRYQIAATTANGRVAASDAQTMHFQVSEQRRDQMRSSSVRFVSAFDLAPGAYRLRGAVIDDRSGEYGIVTGDLVVPDYAKAPSLSSVLVASGSAATPTLRRNASLFGDRLQSPPTTQRTFDVGETIELFLEAYVPSALQDLTAQVELLVPNGRDAGHYPAIIVRRDGIGGRPCFAVSAVIPTSGLEPGVHTFTINLRAPSVVLRREISIRLR
jgi:VWFA-related protein